jgi:hypothetical protein
MRSVHPTRSHVRHLVAGELHDRPALDPAVLTDRLWWVVQACFRVIGEIVLPRNLPAPCGNPVRLAHDAQDVGLGRRATLSLSFQACAMSRPGEPQPTWASAQSNNAILISL